MICEIVNPSDRAYLTGEDEVAIALAVAHLGAGIYAAKQVDGPFEVPPFAFVRGMEGWFSERGVTPKTALDGREGALADILASVRLAEDAEDYRGVLALTGADLDAEHDRRRSSTNDFCRWAWETAARLREAVRP